MTILIGLDLGTSKIKALALEVQTGQVIKVASQPTPVEHPSTGWSQHDPEALYVTAMACLREVAGGQQVAALAISSFGEAGLPLDDYMRPLYPIIAWYDRRCEPQAAWLDNRLPPAELHGIAGQRASTSFAICKWLWIAQNLPEIALKTAFWLSAPDYLVWRLTGRIATDRTIASRTLMFDQNTLDWSLTLLQLAGLEKRQLPAVFPSGTCIGYTQPASEQQSGLPAGTPVVMGGHDHLCAALAAGAFQPGSTVDSTGTAQAIIMLMPDFFTSAALAQGGFACYAYLLPGLYALKGGLKSAGGAVEWLARQLSAPGMDADRLPYAMLEDEAWEGVGARAGPIWLPHLIASGTPESDRLSRAALVGLKAEHNRGDLFRGLLEALAFYLRHNLEEMHKFSGQQPRSVILLGGATRLRLLAQLKADITHLPVYIPELPEAAACGAALLAGLGAGVFKNTAEASACLRFQTAVLEPDPRRLSWYDHLYESVYRPLYLALKDIHHRMDEIEAESLATKRFGL